MVFSDGEEALDFMLDNLHNDKELPDVIFLDIDMPIMDGFQFMEEYIKIKPKLGKKITIYMVSSSVDPVDIERAKKISDITDYMVKPVTHDQLKHIVGDLGLNE
jgi:CheY-like chemotaxis protein